MDTPISDSERQAVDNVIRSTGRDPGKFHFTVQPDGFIRVVGPRGTACYPCQSWLMRFSRHLNRSFFDDELPAPQGPLFARAHAGAGESQELDMRYAQRQC